MSTKLTQFKRSAIALSITSCLISTSVFAQEQDDGEIEVINVTGIRGSQVASINIKRSANSVVDAISAVDIGKLPDATIADSLQRISGVQIRRSAGEGASINVRGLPQVVTQLNGEQYLGANSVVSTQPNFSDVPSQLFNGAEVYKSPTATLGNSGISGTVNLKTYRPFDFDDGFTAAGSAEMQYGEESGEADPILSGLVNWNNDKYGFLISASVANVNLSNSYNGLNTGDPGDAGWTSRFRDTTVGLADQNRRYVGAQGFSAWNQITERERVGINASFQADLGEGFILTTDWFYTDQDEYNRKVGLSATNKWQGDDWFTPTAERATGAEIDDGEFYAWTSANLSPKRLKSFTQNDVFHSSSQNINLQLDYDNGGAFTGSFRAIIGDADKKKRHGYNEGDLTNGQTTLGRTTNLLPADKCRPEDEVVGDLGGCLQAINPLGYSENPNITYDTSGTHPTWGGFGNPLAGGLGTGNTVADYMANLDSYNIGAYSSENNENSDGSLTAFSLKGNYALEEGFITSIDLGIRSSQRSASFERFHLFSPFHNAGCEAQWKATDVLLNSTAPGSCQDGEVVNGEWQPYVVLGNVPLDQNNNVNFYTDFGPVNGIPGVWAVDPADYDDPEAFHNRVFGSTTKNIVPGSSFAVDMDELSYFFQANFEAADGDLTGNFGIRVVETDLTVKQNIAGAGKPYGNTAFDVGDLLSKRDYRDILPTLNVAYDINEDMVLRFAYSENMVPLDLNQYGDGLSLNTALDSTPDSPTFNQFIVTGGSLAGNPELDPWRSTNLDVSFEYYLGDASLVNVAVFKVDIDSFTESTSVILPQPDADGVVRREVPISTLAQGKGGTLKGIELAAKLAFSDFLDEGSPLINFGLDANYTYSPSETESKDTFGKTNLFPDNSENQFNLIGWYQSDRFQARIAYNYRSERLHSQGGAAWGALNVIQEETAYVDISASYDVTEAVTVYLSGSNITGEFENYYLEFEDQLAFQNFYEARYNLGVRAKF